MQGQSSKEGRGDEGRHQEEEEQQFPAGAGEVVPNPDHSLPLLASLRTFSSFNWGLATVAAVSLILSFCGMVALPAT